MSISFPSSPLLLSHLENTSWALYSPNTQTPIQQFIKAIVSRDTQALHSILVGHGINPNQYIPLSDWLDKMGDEYGDEFEKLPNNLQEKIEALSLMLYFSVCPSLVAQTPISALYYTVLFEDLDCFKLLIDLGASPKLPVTNINLEEYQRNLHAYIRQTYLEYPKENEFQPQNDAIPSLEDKDYWLQEELLPPFYQEKFISLDGRTDSLFKLEAVQYLISKGYLLEDFLCEEAKGHYNYQQLTQLIETYRRLTPDLIKLMV